MIRAGPSSSSLPHWVSFSLKPTTHHLRLVWIRTTAGMEASCFHLCNDASTPLVDIWLIVKIPVVQEGGGFFLC